MRLFLGALVVAIVVAIASAYFQNAWNAGHQPLAPHSQRR
jgi:hypothetical protein